MFCFGVDVQQVRFSYTGKNKIDSSILTGAVLGRQNTFSEQPPAQYGRR